VENFRGLLPLNDERLREALGPGGALPEGAVGLMWGDPPLAIMEIDAEEGILAYRCAPTDRSWKPGDPMLTMYATSHPDDDVAFVSHVLDEAKAYRDGTIEEA
jgi:hypothetical protein